MGDETKYLMKNIKSAVIEANQIILKSTTMNKTEQERAHSQLANALYLLQEIESLL